VFFEYGILFSKKKRNNFQTRPFELDYFLSIELPSPWKGLHGMGESVRERESEKGLSKKLHIFLI
jgi:hypothetical protein